MAGVPNENNNPGDLRFAGQANATQGSNGFAEFPSPAEGYTALLNDVQAKINRNPNETLEQFSSIYAPADDGNDPIQYTAKLANQLGVPPTATIGSLEPQISKFADAIANNEGYTPSQNSGIGSVANSGTANALGQTAGAAVNAVGGPAGALGLGALGAGAAALGGEALAGGEVLAGGIGDLAGSVVGGIKGLFGGNSQAPTVQPQTPVQPNVSSLFGNMSQPSEPAAQTPPAIPQFPTPSNPSGMYSSLSDALTSMVGGQQIMQEGKNRNIDPITALENSGAIAHLQPDESGNYNKVAATGYLNNLIASDKGFQRNAVNSMQTGTNLQDMRAAAHREIDSAMADTGERGAGHKEVDRIFDDYFSELPRKQRQNGQSYISSFSLSPARLQKKKELLSASEKDFAKPRHERDAATHVKEAMRKRLSEIAKKEGVKGWDETNKRMEAHILARKAVKKLPKKAQRDKMREFRKDLIGALAGAAIGKTLGNGILGGTAGYLIQQRLGKKEYKRLGSHHEQKAAEDRGNTKLRGLISLPSNHAKAK